VVAKPTFYYITGGLFTKVFYSTASSGGLFLLKLQEKRASVKCRCPFQIVEKLIIIKPHAVKYIANTA